MKYRGQYLDHIRVVGLFRDLNAKDEIGNQDRAFGWATGISTKINLPFLGKKDNLKLNVQYGEGYGAALKSGPFDGGINPETGRLELVGVFSAYGGIQHYWTDPVRSNIVFGYVSANNPSFFSPDRIKSNTYIAANIIWQPLKSLQLGLEYLYGNRVNIDNSKGHANRVLFSSKVTF